MGKMLENENLSTNDQNFDTIGKITEKLYKAFYPPF